MNSYANIQPQAKQPEMKPISKNMLDYLDTVQVGTEINTGTGATYQDYRSACSLAEIKPDTFQDFKSGLEAAGLDISGDIITGLALPA